MFESLLRCDGLELLQRKPAKRSARRREPDGFYLGMRADAQALMDSVVLAVDGQNGHFVFSRGGGEDFARGDHAFLVRKSHRLAGKDGSMRGFESRDTNDGGDDEISFSECGARDGALGAVHNFNFIDTCHAAAASTMLRPALLSPARRSSAASGRLVQRLRQYCALRPTRPQSSAREIVRRWRVCFARSSRSSREWRVASMLCRLPRYYYRRHRTAAAVTLHGLQAD